MATSALSEAMKTILIVDNHTIIQNMLDHYFHQLAYTVLLADSARGALEQAISYEKEIHLLLTNMFLPDIPGNQLADHVRSIRPGIECLFMSSFAYHDLINEGMKILEDRFFQKPISFDRLEQTIQMLV